MNCEKYKILIQQYLEGTIDSENLNELKSHADNCQECREELQKCIQIERLIKEGFAARTNPARAKDLIMAELSSSEVSLPKPVFMSCKAWLSVAAAILILAGLLFYVHTKSTTKVTTPVIVKTVETPPNQSPADMLTVRSLTMAYQKGGMKALEEQCDKAGRLLWSPPPKNITVKELLSNSNGT